MDTFYVRFIAKLKDAGGSSVRSPLKVSLPKAAWGAGGGFIVIFLLTMLTEKSDLVWIMAPFGATCVLVFGIWDSPLSQPRNVIGGHFISTAVGLLLYHWFGQGSLVMAAGVGLAIGLMMLTKTTHPPAGADPLVVIMAGSSWSFLINPVLLGAIVIVGMALVINNLDKTKKYPTFWR
ncbi:HPP family protein [Paenibacillus sp. KS-LC4]|uniref:HPP family protein n=1 Tax=Paenibacillus sp. KS-LC4 TaxID=2979727 RepID=UPI0030D258AE